MKKYTLYILILIMLTGLFGSVQSVNAVVPTSALGTCKFYSSGTTIAFERTIYDTCRVKTGYFSWKESTLAEFQAEATPADPTVTCWVEKADGSYETITTTQTGCTQRSGTTQKPAGAGGSIPDNKNYTFLAPLPCEIGKDVGCEMVDGKPVLKTFDPTGNNKIGSYLNLIIKLFIGICAVLAVVMIVVGGIEYMTSELPGNKEAGKGRIRGAIFGLILALGAYALLFTINPDLLNTELKSLTAVTVNVTLENQIKSYTGQGKCEPIASGICSPASLATAGFLPEPPRATQASSICNGESKGAATLASGVDKCSDGNSFSFGLFQVNVLAHANEIPGGVCSNIFKTNGGGTQGACLQKQGNICIKYDCSVVDSAKYQSCISYITNSTNNIAYAKGLQASRGWGQWGAYSSCRSQF